METYKFVVATHGGDCTCFKCGFRKVEKEFREVVKNLSTHFGFVPRDYSSDYGYNKIEFRKGGKAQVTQEDMNRILAHVKETINLNKSNKKMKQAFCIDCGLKHTRSQQKFIVENGQKKYICSNCFQKKYIFCHDCKSILRKEFATVINGGAKSVCKKCFLENYTQCQVCGNAHERKSTVTVELGHQKAQKQMCKNCAAKVVACSECGDLFMKNQMHHVDINVYLCSECQESNVPLKNYQYKPHPFWAIDKNFQRKFRKDMLMFGVEWEVENGGEMKNESAIKKLMEVLDKKFFYCKKDSTIKNGFEVVTHPFSWERYKSMIEKWDSAIGLLDMLDFKAKCPDPSWPKTCGIHIHMSKSAFTTAHLYKFMKFIYKKDNRKFIIDISQRGKESEYAAFHHTDVENLAHCARNKTNASGDHHSAIELLHPHTVEIRIFNSTMEKLDFHKNLEFCHSLYEFTKNCSFKETTLENYMHYIIKVKPKTYKNLYKFMRDKMDCTKYTKLTFNYSK